ncbi:unnamed protein product [Phaeothamnion confervicola]
MCCGGRMVSVLEGGYGRAPGAAAVAAANAASLVAAATQAAASEDSGGGGSGGAGKRRRKLSAVEQTMATESSGAFSASASDDEGGGGGGGKEAPPLGGSYSYQVKTNAHELDRSCLGEMAVAHVAALVDPYRRVVEEEARMRALGAGGPPPAASGGGGGGSGGSGGGGSGGGGTAVLPATGSARGSRVRGQHLGRLPERGARSVGRSGDREAGRHFQLDSRCGTVVSLLPLSEFSVRRFVAWPLRRGLRQRVSSLVARDNEAEAGKARPHTRRVRGHSKRGRLGTHDGPAVAQKVTRKGGRTRISLEAGWRNGSGGDDGGGGGGRGGGRGGRSSGDSRGSGGRLSVCWKGLRSTAEASIAPQPLSAGDGGRHHDRDGGSCAGCRFTVAGVSYGAAGVRRERLCMGERERVGLTIGWRGAALLSQARMNGGPREKADRDHDVLGGAFYPPGRVGGDHGGGGGGGGGSGGAAAAARHFLARIFSGP